MEYIGANMLRIAVATSYVGVRYFQLERQVPDMMNVLWLGK